MLLLTLRGTPTIYYGEEIGMSDVSIPPALVQDPWEKQVPGHGLGRDPVRTPMVWTGDRHGGFTTGTPWLPLGRDAATRNVAVQTNDHQSLLSLYRDLLRLRRDEPALAVGTCAMVAAERSVLRYERHHAGRQLGIYLNFRDDPVEVSCRPRNIVYTTATRSLRGAVDDKVRLLDHEGVVINHTA